MFKNTSKSHSGEGGIYTLKRSAIDFNTKNRTTTGFKVEENEENFSPLTYITMDKIRSLKLCLLMSYVIMLEHTQVITKY